MKVALLLSGQLREFEDCFLNTNERILQACSPDVYIYSNYEQGRSEKAISLYNPRRHHFELEEDKALSAWPGETPRELTKVQDPPSDWSPEKLMERRRYTFLQQYRKVNACFNLLEEEYDLVIRARFDCKINVTINDNFLKSLDPDAYHIPAGGNHGGINDTMCISSLDNMKHYCNLYNKVGLYCLEEKIKFHTETLLKRHLRDFPINRFQCAVLLRGRVHNFIGS